MKKKIISALTILMCAVMLTACGDKETDTVDLVVPEIESIPVQQEEVVENDGDVVEVENKVAMEDELPAGMYFSELTHLPIDESLKNQIVWHGGMNLLGKADVWDNLMRIKNVEVAAELLEISLR